MKCGFRGYRDEEGEGGICNNGRQGTHVKNQVVLTMGIAEGRLDELDFSQGGIKDHGPLKIISGNT